MSPFILSSTDVIALLIVAAGATFFNLVIIPVTLRCIKRCWMEKKKKKKEDLDNAVGIDQGSSRTLEYRERLRTDMQKIASEYQAALQRGYLESNAAMQFLAATKRMINTHIKDKKEEHEISRVKESKHEGKKSQQQVHTDEIEEKQEQQRKITNLKWPAELTAELFQSLTELQ